MPRLLSNPLGRYTPDLTGSAASGWPAAELQAMRAEGEVWECAGAAVTWGEPPVARLRAAVLQELLPAAARLGAIAERGSAAWILGALPAAPQPHCLAIDREHRVRISPGAGFHWREVAIAADEWCRIGGLRVTTPSRTIVDLSRTAVAALHAPPVLLRLAAIDGTDLAALAERIEAGPSLPQKIPAVRRIRAAARCADAQAFGDTRYAS